MTNELARRTAWIMKMKPTREDNGTPTPRQGPWFDVKPPFNHPWFNTTFGGGVQPPMAGLTPLLGEVFNHPVVERLNTG